MARYQWTSATEWLLEKIEKTQDVKELAQIATTLANKLDADSIQDEFQAEMAEAGFFKDLEPLDVVNRFSRSSLETLLTNVSIQCYDTESTEELREAVRANYMDDTISAESIYSIEEENS